ncbi:glucose-6-phosphate isomerase [Bordetella sp. 02P26C-1]|uniref:glucose-6-phosphate isomerase n=1 Tax=Bordetella sp. 02P26C-1 TaxID=2683195 RepID=UPI001354341F|nr:glucose-6-phosphate isomerase [Bordetella sp. 02P26C-1]MVW79800.1 glucose-6-phosphate isomerase [Bordetella sp. 02P26C-1]
MLHASSSDVPSVTELDEWSKFEEATQRADCRGERLRVIDAAGLCVDLSAQPGSEELNKASDALLRVRDFTRMRRRLLEGGVVNPTEDRAAWHSMLREPSPTPEVAHERNRLLQFVQRADNERRWRHVLHIGIGGSDWGLRLTVAAFGYTGTWRDIRFVANIDGHAIEGGIAGLNPHETVVVIASKSFATAETLENARRALEWLRASGVKCPERQLVAVTARPALAREFGVPEDQIFPFWDWVGGRFSFWSSVCVSTALTVGTDVMAGMLAGAHAMDEHFRTAPIERNAPVQLALAGVANRSVLGLSSLNISVYDSRLFHLVPYLQQLEMESLGKSVTIAGEPVGVPTGPAVWGMPGTDAQHTFFQWLHQGDGAAVDFIVCQQADHRWPEHHQQLIANCLAQREALLRGKSYEEVLAEMEGTGDPEHVKWLAKHKVYPGGRPSNLIVLPRLSPYTLGALIALYEHKVFVQALIWGINPFDQWGVELGKTLTARIRKDWESMSEGKCDAVSSHDPSTQYWLERFAPSRK